MERTTPSLDPARLREVLATFLDAIAPTCAAMDYRLVGTGACLLHGVSLPAGDIDILVRERGAVDAFCAALSPFKCIEPPAWLPTARQYYGNYDVRDVEVGISTVEIDSSADTIETFGRGPWEHYAFIACGQHTVPTVALELRLITELCRNRPERYRPIVQFLRLHGCDRAFISRGLSAAGLRQAIAEDVLAQLSDAPHRPVATQGRR